jgi:hypothetical protein
LGFLNCHSPCIFIHILLLFISISNTSPDLKFNLKTKSKFDILVEEKKFFLIEEKMSPSSAVESTNQRWSNHFHGIGTQCCPVQRGRPILVQPENGRPRRHPYKTCRTDYWLNILIKLKYKIDCNPKLVNALFPIKYSVFTLWWEFKLQSKCPMIF